jgi:IclR family acetate operon transcriptional repressor
VSERGVGRARAAKPRRDEEPSDRPPGGSRGERRRASSDGRSPDDALQNRYWVRAVDRTVQLLRVLAQRDGRPKTLGEVAALAEMPESSALRYLATLAALGVVEHDGARMDGRYRLGLGLFSLAEQAVGSTDVRTLARPVMHALRDRYHETVNLAIFRSRQLVIIDALEGLRSIRQGARVGERDRLRSTALGKAVLAAHSNDEALELLRGEPLDPLTPRTITKDAVMLRELQAIREQGYAIDDEESELGLRCVGVAVPGRSGAFFALSISGPSNVFSLERAHEAGPELVAAAGELSRGLGSELGRHGRAPSRGRRTGKEVLPTARC